MSKDLSTLKDELEAANSDNRKIELKGEIENITDIAENAIRNHQREVDYDTKEFTTEIVANKYGEGLTDDTNELFVPDYQRDFVWKLENQSRFIESLLIGLPVPYIFIADVKSDDPDLDGRVEIVDGSQRVRTIHAFLSDQLKLQGLKLIQQINGFRFSDLPASRQRRFRRISIRIIELSDCTESTRRDLFERINTGLDELKDMEVRKGSKYGNSALFSKVISVCADSDRFKQVVPISKAKQIRGEDLEFSLRFFAYLYNYKSFDHSVKDFLDKYLITNAEPDEDKITEMLAIFDNTMQFAIDHFPHGFRKTSGSKTTPRVRFEALAVGIALALKQKPNLKPQGISDWLFGSEFKKQTTADAANSRPRVKNRIEFVRDKLLAGQ